METETNIDVLNKDYAYEVKEVVEWRSQNESAYWKSRALALEYENKMLLELVKSICFKQVEKNDKIHSICSE